MFFYDAALKPLVLGIKYQGVFAAREWVVPQLAEQIKILSFDQSVHRDKLLLTSVPSSQATLITRGYNQSEMIAKALAKQVSIPYVSILARTKQQSISQTMLTKAERWRNMADQFTLHDKAPPLTNKAVVIIDDVFTTGATIEHCARILKAAGAAKVWAITIAKDELAG